MMVLRFSLHSLPDPLEKAPYYLVKLESIYDAFAVKFSERACQGPVRLDCESQKQATGSRQVYSSHLDASVQIPSGPMGKGSNVAMFLDCHGE